MKKYDAILILGGGLKKNGAVSPWTKRRIEKALEIFSGREYIIAPSAGTTHKPPVLKNGFPLYESVATANYLLKKGIPRQKILTETVSLDTIGNAYFARTIHTEPRNFKRLCIITSQFHMPRTIAIFKWIFSLKPSRFNYELDFVEAPDKGIDEKIMKARREKEKHSLKQITKTKKRINSLSKLHRWLFTKHQAYAAGFKPKRSKGKILKM